MLKEDLYGLPVDEVALGILDVDEALNLSWHGAVDDILPVGVGDVVLRGHRHEHLELVFLFGDPFRDGSHGLGPCGFIQETEFGFELLWRPSGYVLANASGAFKSFSLSYRAQMCPSFSCERMMHPIVQLTVQSMGNRVFANIVECWPSAIGIAASIVSVITCREPGMQLSSLTNTRSYHSVTSWIGSVPEICEVSILLSMSRVTRGAAEVVGNPGGKRRRH